MTGYGQSRPHCFDTVYTKNKTIYWVTDSQPRVQWNYWLPRPPAATTADQDIILLTDIIKMILKRLGFDTFDQNYNVRVPKTS